MRRSAPVVVAVGLLLLLGSEVWYTQRVLRQLRGESANAGRMYARVFGALADPQGDGTDFALALVDVTNAIGDLGVPMIVTDASGRPTDARNLPFAASVHDAAVAEYVKRLDRENPPVTLPGGGKVHFGDSKLVQGMRVIPYLQVALIGVLLVTGVVILTTRSRAERESVFAGMARESAHQLGTPLSSLSGWVELLRERDDPMIAQAVPHMDNDVERLERVAHRFERIGRPPKREVVDLAELARHVVGYFAKRVPTLAHSIAISFERADGSTEVSGDRVLLEWALESLVKNAIDALAGRGGTIVVTVSPIAGDGVRVRVADDGPGVPRHLRRKIFAAGFTTKERGWGIGLALTKRIVEENHGGRLRLVPSDRGAVFDVILPG
ncbi:MAG: HAMP domain-containing histidine kinase [Gemmatimonadetes bacterium]|nr:HAMP domain-containing histidine kinase [Gemmatimonadota bacterium]MBI3567460.1 HAMP domain-containing histidine kinase [Gemmatimonadota bacterium]